MSHKSARIATMIESFRGHELDAHYLGYFDCFNRQLFYEAHDVLEDLWLADKYGANGDFYKGLIQLAGAFVHLQKNRLRPSAALFKLARTNLEKYPPLHEQLNLEAVQFMIAGWLFRLEKDDFTINPLLPTCVPQLALSKTINRRKSVAIIGASADRGKFGNKAVRAFVRQGYIVYPVNPKETQIEGLPAFSHIAEVTVRPNLISVYLPPPVLLKTLPDIAARGCDELWLNPGTESAHVLAEARRLGLNVIQACSIVAIGLSPEEV